MELEREDLKKKKIKGDILIIAVIISAMFLVKYYDKPCNCNLRGVKKGTHEILEYIDKGDTTYKIIER